MFFRFCIICSVEKAYDGCQKYRQKTTNLLNVTHKLTPTLNSNYFEHKMWLWSLYLLIKTLV